MGGRRGVAGGVGFRVGGRVGEEGVGAEVVAGKIHAVIGNL